MSMILVIHGLCIRAHRLMIATQSRCQIRWTSAFIRWQSDCTVFQQLCNIWIFSVYENTWKCESVFCMKGSRKIQHYYKTGGHTRRNAEMNTAIIAQEPNQGWVGTKDRYEEYNYTLCFIFISSGTSLLSFVEVKQFVRQLAGFSRSRLYMSRRGLSPQGVWWRSQVPEVMFWPYATISNNSQTLYEVYICCRII